ncbi:DUF4276 family protein [bacterium]|nr:DUF4276 family protein [bacterium]
MVKVLVLVEGQTEERFVNDVLSLHFNSSEYEIIPKRVTTKQVLIGADFKGGYISYAKFKRQVLNLLNDTSATAVTTMIDYYKLPSDFPEIQTLNEIDCMKRVEVIETSLSNDINNPKFIPYLQLHEFEAVLFSNPSVISAYFSLKKKLTSEINKISSQFSSPEHINLDNPPSKRLQSLLPDYDKVVSGTAISLEIGLERIRQECPHFNEWIEKLESLK